MSEDDTTEIAPRAIDILFLLLMLLMAVDMRQLDRLLMRTIVTSFRKHEIDGMK